MITPGSTRVVGPKLIIPDKEYASLEMGLRTLELVLASKNCLAA